jgi:hypothetical protein
MQEQGSEGSRVSQRCCEGVRGGSLVLRLQGGTGRQPSVLAQELQSGSRSVDESRDQGKQSDRERWVCGLLWGSGV